MIAVLTRSERGFTLVELVTVMVIIGILSAAAAPRFFDTAVFANRGYANDVRATLRYAQKLAVGSGCAIRFASDASGYAVWRWTGATCTDRSGRLVQATRPGGGALAAVAPAQVTLNTLDIFFDPVGRPRATVDGALLLATQNLTVGTDTITIEAETGLVQ